MSGKNKHPAPAPTPAPTPAPVQTPVESADGTKGVKIVDSQLSTWTIGTGGELLRNNWDTGGRGSIYLYHQHEVYALGTDNNWWVCRMVWTNVGTEPGVVAAPPTPTPAPTPTPVPQPTPAPVTGESPDRTRGSSVTDADLAVWSINANLSLLRAGVDTGGRGSEYVYFNHQVYALGTDHNWWVYGNGAWSLAGEDPSIVPYDTTPVNTKTCVNLAMFGFYGGVDPFINRFKRSSRWWNIGGKDLPWYISKPDNWLYGIPPGELAIDLVTVNDVQGETDLTEQRSGKHYLMWKSGLDLTMDGLGTEVGKLVAPGEYVFNIPATILVDGVPTLANPALNLRVTNNTGKVADLVPVVVAGVQYPALVHEDDLTDFFAGKHYQKSFIHGLSDASYIRSMDWNNSCLEGISSVAGHEGEISAATIQPQNFQTEFHRTYVGPDDNSLVFPPEELGNLCLEANVGLFNTLPTKTTDDGFHYWAQNFTKAVGPDWNLTVLSELGDENWNFAFPWNIGGQFLINQVVPHIKVIDIDGNPSQEGVNQIGCGCAERALRMWAIMEQYIPRERHKRVLGGQWAWTTGMGGMLSYVDPVTGKKAGELADYYAVAPYWGCDLTNDATGKYYTLDEILDQKLWLKGDQWWIDRCTSAITKDLATLKTNQKFLAKYAPGLKLTMYEGGGWLHEIPLPRQNQPRHDEAKVFDNFCRSFMDGASGKTVEQFYWDTLIKGNFAHYNKYHSQGYSFGVQVGQHMSQHRADIPRQALFRSLGK